LPQQREWSVYGDEGIRRGRIEKPAMSAAANSIRVICMDGNIRLILAFNNSDKRSLALDSPSPTRCSP